MRSKINLLGHAVHPFLVAFPLGLLLLVPVFDVVNLATHHLEWSHLSFWLLTCGLIGALVAAPVGLFDFLEVPRGTQARRIGLAHLGANLAAVALYGISWVIRLAEGWQRSGVGPFLLALAGLIVLLAGGWLGNELVQRYGMSISPDANLDAAPTRPVPARRPEVPIHHEPEPTA
jgi:uncharacterized membrane protein